MDFPVVPEELSALSDAELAELESQLVAAFNEATADGAELKDEDVAQFTAVADGIDNIRTELGVRAEAEAARNEQIAQLASRVNANKDEGEEEGDEEGEVAAEETPSNVSPEPAIPAEGPAVADTGARTVHETGTPQANPANGQASRRQVTASVAAMKRNAPARTQPREEAPVGTMSLVAAGGIEGINAGTQVSFRRAAELLLEQKHRLGPSPAEDSVPVARFTREVPEERKLSPDMSSDQVMARINSFDRTPQGIQAAGGLCAPVNSYYGQMVIADAGRPVRDALANFNADRGGIRFNPPPKLSQISSGVGTVTAAQDLAGGGGATKNCFTVTCPAATEVDVTAVYNCLTFGNFGARAFPEQVEAWTQLAMALQARTAEQMLLDGIAAASTTVTTAGLVGAGRELFARYAQAAAGYRSRNRMQPNAPLRVLLPGWSLDLIQADFSRTFAGGLDFISTDDNRIIELFRTENLNLTLYRDSKTGGGQVIGAAQGGQTYTDVGTTSGSGNVTSATAAFTASDVGKTISGTNIAAGATITSVTNATTVVVSPVSTGTGTNQTATIGRTTLQQFPTTLYGYMFAEGSFLHLDAGTLDLGLVRDSTLNSTNQFRMFTETFENVALVGPESLEIVSTLNADGSYAAARSITLPINS